MNRPFARYCRRCKARQSQHGLHPPGHERWGPFAGCSSFSRQTAEQLGPCVPAIVTEFRLEPGYIRPDTLWSFTWIDGLLAIHQGDGFAALVHPFADAAHNGGQAVCWSAREASQIPIPPGAEETDRVRAYPPVATPDRRFVLFSTPRGAFAVDLWTLPGWGVSASPRVLRLAPMGEQSAELLATSPMPLSTNWNGGTGAAECLVGLLFHAPNGDPAPYRWVVMDLACQSGPQIKFDHCVLPLIGHPAQILASPDHVIVFATPQGHWWWSWDAATRADTSAIQGGHVRTPGEVLLALDRQVVHTGLFTMRLQHLICPRDELRSARGNGAFELFYSTQRRDSPNVAGGAEYYMVHPLRETPCDNPISWEIRNRESLPIGVDRSTNTVLLMGSSVGGGRGADLSRRSLGEHAPGKSAEVYDDFRRVIGAQVNPPGLILVCNDDDKGHGKFVVHVTDLESNRRVMDYHGVRLIADPLIVDRYLFTLEDDDSGARLIRRNLFPKSET